MVGYDKNESLTPDQKLIASMLSGVITRSMTNPLDVVKVRAQLQKKAISNPNRQWFQITRTIIKETGVKSLWRGHYVGQVFCGPSIQYISPRLWLGSLQKYTRPSPSFAWQAFF